MGYLLLFVLGGTIWLLTGGIGELKLALENPEPQTISIDEFNKAPRQSGWFRITDCVIDLTEAMYTESGGSIDELFLPVGSRSGAETTSLLLRTDDPAIMQKVIDIGAALDSLQTDEQKSEHLLEHTGDLILTEPVEGMTEYGLDDMEDELRSQAQGMSILDDGFVVLTHRDHPNMISGLLKTIAGLLIPIGALVLWKKGRDAEKIEAKNRAARADESNDPAAQSDSPENEPGR